MLQGLVKYVTDPGEGEVMKLIRERGKAMIDVFSEYLEKLYPSEEESKN